MRNNRQKTPGHVAHTQHRRTRHSQNTQHNNTGELNTHTTHATQGDAKTLGKMLAMGADANIATLNGKKFSKFSKFQYTVTSYSKDTKALTFENFCQGGPL